MKLATSFILLFSLFCSPSQGVKGWIAGETIFLNHFTVPIQTEVKSIADSGSTNHADDRSLPTDLGSMWHFNFNEAQSPLPDSIAPSKDYKSIAAAVTKNAVGPLTGTHSGTPYNDLVEFLPHMSYVEGETAGYDTFYPVACEGKWPGSDEVITVNCCSRPDYDVKNMGARGDRIILGTSKHGVFFLKGSDNQDNDYCHISNFDYGYGHIQLAGAPAWYHLEHCTAKTDGTRWDGWALFYIGDGAIDLIAFVDDCASQYRKTATGLELLDLNNPVQFQYAKPVDNKVEFSGGIQQLGTVANDSLVAVTADTKGNFYVTGHSEGDINPGDGLKPEINKAWIASYSQNGTRRWIRTFQLGPGGSTWDITTDDSYIYAVGRDWRGMSAKWDAFIWKLDCSTGNRIAEDVYTSTELDGYGNVVVSGDVLYVSGQGGVLNGHDYLIAAHKTSNLKNLWRHFYNPFPSTNKNPAEAWGGIAIAPKLNQLYTTGWWFNRKDGFDTDGWACAYKADTGKLAWKAHQDIDSPNPGRTEWSLGCAVDSKGNLYVAGYTTGNLGSTHKGQGDLFIRKYASTGTVVWTKQWGTNYTDSFRRLVVDENDILYAVGYTYGDLAAKNRDASHRTADIYIASLDVNGKLIGEKQFGTEEEDRAFPYVKNGKLYLVGTTEGSMTGQNQGACDGFIVMLSAKTLSAFPSTIISDF